MAVKFSVGWTGDFRGPDGQPVYRDVGQEVLKGVPGLSVTHLEEHRPELGPDQLAGLQGVIVLTPRVTARSVSSSENLLAIGRFGVGYDHVDVAACTAANVVLSIAAGAVDRSVAEATLAWMLALTHHIRTKDALVRKGLWQERSNYMGCELRGRTLGIIGLGGIGRALVRLLAGFDMNPPLAFDPYADPDVARRLGVWLVPLDELMASADFVSVHCPLTDQTRGLIGARELGRMKPSAYLLNTARGGIVDEAALAEVLRGRQIAGAAVDCFADEPVTRPHPLGEFENVLLAPHSIAWTDELFREIGRTVCRGMLDLAQGRQPHGVVNPEVFDRPEFQAKWARLTLDGHP